MVWERHRVGATTDFDANTAAVLTFLFYKPLLSYVCSNINKFPMVTQRKFLSFLFVLWKVHTSAVILTFLLDQSNLTIRILLKVKLLKLKKFAFIISEMFIQPPLY